MVYVLSTSSFLFQNINREPSTWPGDWEVWLWSRGPVWFVVAEIVVTGQIHWIPLSLPDPRHIHLGPGLSWIKVSWTLTYIVVSDKSFHSFAVWSSVLNLTDPSLPSPSLLSFWRKKKPTFQSFAEFTHKDPTNKFLTQKIKDIYVQHTKRKSLAYIRAPLFAKLNQTETNVWKAKTNTDIFCFLKRGSITQKCCLLCWL